MAGLKLACHHGTYRMGETTLRRLGEGAWALVVPCDLGDHYLRPNAAVDGAYVFGTEPYGFPSWEDAQAAAEAYKAALERRYR